MVPDDEHIVPFKEHDIVPAKINPAAHAIITRFFKMREDIAHEMTLRSPDAPNTLEPFDMLDQTHNECNRLMFQAYANYANFMTYCKPHLRHLPPFVSHVLQVHRSIMLNADLFALNAKLDEQLFKLLVRLQPLPGRRATYK